MKPSRNQTLAGILMLATVLALPVWGETGSQSPFDSDDPVAIQYQQDRSGQGTAVAAAGTGGTDDEETAGEAYPCEGTVNCHRRQNVRTGPWGKIIDGFVPGTRVQIVAREGDWYRIKYGNTYAFLHRSLVDTPFAKAYDGPNPSPYPDRKKPATSADKPTSGQASPTTTGKTGGINGPEIPACLLKGLEAAKKSIWFRTKDKCLQFAGTLVAEAGAKVKKSQAIYPHLAYKPDTSLRGAKINTLDEAALAGRLKPGMLIHVKVAYDKDPAYNPTTNAHHWFAYMGLKNGVPMFADCLRQGRLQTIDEVNRNMAAGRALLPQYKPYGNIRRVTAIHDPFADQR